MSEQIPPNEGVQDGAEPLENGTKDTQDRSDYVEAIVKDRLIRADRAHQKELKKLREEYESKLGSAKPNKSLEDDYRDKLTQREAENKALLERLSKIQSEGLRASVKAKLAEKGCVDPDDISELFISRKMVELDDEGKVVLNTADKDLDELVQNYLAKKPHLMKPSNSGGLGSKGPNNPAASGMSSIQEMETLLGIKRQSGNKLFGR